jgi:hypothetical protein
VVIEQDNARNFVRSWGWHRRDVRLTLSELSAMAGRKPAEKAIRAWWLGPIACRAVAVVQGLGESGSANWSAPALWARICGNLTAALSTPGRDQLLFADPW